MRAWLVGAYVYICLFSDWFGRKQRFAWTTRLTGVIWKEVELSRTYIRNKPLASG